MDLIREVGGGVPSLFWRAALETGQVRALHDQADALPFDREQ